MLPTPSMFVGGFGCWSGVIRDSNLPCLGSWEPKTLGGKLDSDPAEYGGSFWLLVTSSIVLNSLYLIIVLLTDTFIIGLISSACPSDNFLSVDVHADTCLVLEISLPSIPS